jgi:AAT family amino acid transporter
VDFISYYIELPIMLIMYLGWKFWKRTKIVKLEEMDLVTDVYELQPGELDKFHRPGWKGKVETAIRWVF